MSETYTRNGETELELVYDEIPDDNDANVYLVPVNADDGAKSISVTVGEFNNEFEAYEEDDDMATKYLRERARNGWGHQ